MNQCLVAFLSVYMRAMFVHRIALFTPETLVRLELCISDTMYFCLASSNLRLVIVIFVISRIYVTFKLQQKFNKRRNG